MLLWLTIYFENETSCTRKNLTYSTGVIWVEAMAFLPSVSSTSTKCPHTILGIFATYALFACLSVQGHLGLLPLSSLFKLGLLCRQYFFAIVSLFVKEIDHLIIFWDSSVIMLVKLSVDSVAQIKDQNLSKLITHSI